MSLPTPVDLHASLECECHGNGFTVSARDGVIVVRVDSRKSARALVGAARRFGTLRSNIARLNKVLFATTHRLELHVGDQTVAAMGWGIYSGFLSLAGLHHVRVWPSRLLRG